MQQYAGYIFRTTCHVMIDDIKIAVLPNQISQFMRSIYCFNYMYNKLSILVQRILFKFESKTDENKNEVRLKN